ncbi:MAG TPA: UDP-3-O-(3-hydroxymyristoyl)glucosamine N-acyltransferase [Phycisphaerae bacterium]|nr:UDP-3-O-(3-hydroxymyristoyl)glucosamine N-acyltransferase [Phycisphaerae bacterium]
MSEPPSFTMRALAETCRGRLAEPSRAETRITHPAFIDEADAHAVTWISEGKHAKALRASAAAAVIGTEALLAGDPRGIIVSDPELAFAQILELFGLPYEAPSPGIHPTAVVHPQAHLASGVAVGALAVIHSGAQIGENTVIHEGVSIGKDVRIGRNSAIHDRCVIYDRCEIGHNVIIHAGTVIGADGFGYIFRDGQHRKVPQIGTVIIEDDVEIGANSCIDRAKLGATRIGRGSKIDNLVMVAHNVRIGPLCVLAGQVGLSGSVRLGAGVALGGQVGISHGIRLGDGVQAGAQSGIIGDIADGEIVWGTPARERMGVLRDQARVRKLAAVFDQVAKLEQRVADLEAATDHRETR